jgi:hypothetical protein
MKPIYLVLLFSLITNLLQAQGPWGNYPADNYKQKEFEAYFETIKNNTDVSKQLLTKSKEGRDVEYLLIGSDSEKIKYRMIFQARQHPKEWKNNFVLEGIINAFIGDKWLRKNCQLLVVPFVAKDGVENELDYFVHGVNYNRQWRDTETPMIEVEALKKLYIDWCKDKCVAYFDFHSPNLDGGGGNGYVHTYWTDSVRIETNKKLIGHINKSRTSVNETKAWFNDASGERPGISNFWAKKNIPNLQVGVCIELRENDISPNEARGYGKDIITGLKNWLKD